MFWQNGRVKARRRLLLASCLLLLCTAASPAHAAVKQIQVTGKVLSASRVLAPYGVQKGSVVNITFDVELTTPPFSVLGPPDNETVYCGAINFIVIQIGTWMAIKVAPVVACQNSISVADNSEGTLDLWHIVTPGTDNDLVLHTPGGFLNLSLDFFALFGSASSNQGLDQNPDLYDGGNGSALGPGGGVYFTIDTDGSGGGGGSVVDPTANCRKAQLKAGAKLCKAELGCHAKYAKNPASDPFGAYRDMCLAKAGDSFTSAYDKAAHTAEDKGLACGTTAPASEPLAAITDGVDAVVAEVDAIAPSYPPLESAWLGAAGAACFLSVGAHSANAGKPDADKLAAALEKAALKLDTAAQKAADKAADKGIVFAPPLDIPAFHDAVDDLIDTAISELDGD